ncbi:MAG: hypothetical protein A2X61_04890 [Ignavibacteria bacterium GWB2_35_12]|nr:MAG: hypothetical protein A2X63_11030 [Ignavibacteria bacterium GWA2_35_8]OGU41281.1 MAG: hypothetical protein A2X61_04890 [Ignavibacteria bacterium GWB2_35_12]OGU94760.1 MAG: hypothetical protein A2220_07730 [Ignavibacteria bacterium RIFOXYA2_FULL_35_10]OGV23926.1 MAG: hypothetical protein A2475_02680 [Ignavibacteria bacterium RIFOXYC2_FULL_35_21]
MNKIKDKTFDCLEFKYKAQERIYNEIKNLSPDEEKAYFNRKVKEGSFSDFVGLVTGIESDKTGKLSYVN